MNRLIVEGDWRQLHDDNNYTMNELSHLITNYYQLEEDVAATLCYQYTTHVGAERTRTYREVLGYETIEHKTKINEQGMETPLTTYDVDLSCYLRQGTVVEREITCNPAFMLENLPLIAAEMRRKFHWIPPKESVYLVMDNAGGHGTQETIEEYPR